MSIPPIPPLPVIPPLPGIPPISPGDGTGDKQSEAGPDNDPETPTDPTPTVDCRITSHPSCPPEVDCTVTSHPSCPPETPIPDDSENEQGIGGQDAGAPGGSTSR